MMYETFKPLQARSEANRSQYFAPDFELDVRPSNMDNANSPEYLDKIRSQVIENLKRTQHAPSVQMQDVPRSPLAPGMDDDAEDAMDDEDADANPDARYTQRQWDKYTSKDGELSESEDEEANERMGIRRQPGQRRRRNIMDFQNPNAAEDGVDSGAATPLRSLNGETGRVTKTTSPTRARSRSSTRAVANGRASGAARSTAASSRRSSVAAADVDIEMEQDPEPETAADAQPTNGATRSPSAAPPERQLTPPESPPSAAAQATSTTATTESAAATETAPDPPASTTAPAEASTEASASSEPTASAQTSTDKAPKDENEDVEMADPDESVKKEE